jgi:hypothetical protein
VTPESEECEGDEGLETVESVGDAGEQPDPGIGRFDQALKHETGRDRGRHR